MKFISINNENIYIQLDIYKNIILKNENINQNKGN